MRVRELLAGLAALSLVSAPIAATAAPAARAGSPVGGDSEQLTDAGFGWAIGAVLVVVLGILIFTDGDEDPVSP